MRPSVLLAAIFFLFLAALPAAAAPAPAVKTGHTGAVEALTYSEGSSILFSGGADGTVRGWDPATHELKVRIQVSHLPIKMLALHPLLPRIACLETDGIENFIISVWDYTDKRRLSVHRLGEMPLFLSYSSAGSYLVYGKTAWESLVFLDGQSGRRIPVLEEGFGIVSSVFFSGSEKTLLTYGPSGSIQYWDLETKQRKTRFSTEGGLTHTEFSSGGRFMTGEGSGKIYLIDLLSGNVLDSMIKPDGAAAAFDGQRDHLYILSRDNLQSICSRYDISGGTLSPLGETSFSFPSDHPALAVGNSGLFIGTALGDIHALGLQQAVPDKVAENNLTAILDMAAGEEHLCLSTTDRTILIPFSSLRDSGDTSSGFMPSVYTNSFSRQTGISSGGGDFYLWQTEKEGLVHVLDPAYGFTRSIAASGTPIRDFTLRDDETAVVLDRNNTLKIINLTDGSEEFTYSSFGVRAAVPVSGGVIMAGRNKTSALSAPLLAIHPDTGETVPIEGDNIVTLDLCYDSRRKTLYSLGIEERLGTLKTVLKTHRGASLERSRTLLAFSGEDQSAAFAVDQDDSTVYTSLGYGHVRMYRWGGFTSLQRAERIPRKLEASGGFLFALNTDNTITAWNSRTGRIAAELYFFNDETFAALYPDGTTSTSPGADRYMQ